MLAADVGSLKEEVIEGKTGFVFRPEDAVDLAITIRTYSYFSSDLYADLDRRRDEVRDITAAQHSWGAVGDATTEIYAALLGPSSPRELSNPGSSKESLYTKVSSSECEGQARPMDAKPNN